MRDPADRREAQVLEKIDQVRARRPRLREDAVTLAHGAGGKASAALVDAVFVEAFRNPVLDDLADGAVVDLPHGGQLVVSTDSFVVKPRRFPGGSLGDLAVNGTVNDVVAAGGQPQWLSAAFVIEEGFPVDELRLLAQDMAAAAARAGVVIVTGDTKVVDSGAADGVYVTTTGVGIARRRFSADAVRAGDAVIVSGTLGDHGMAVMLARGDLALDADITSDTAPMAGLVDDLVGAAPNTRWLRDPTRGGLATVLNELAVAAGVGVIMAESALPVRPEVAGACDLLGIDPIHVANEGKMVAVVPADETPSALAALRAHPFGQQAAVIGEIRAEPAGTVLMQTSFGGSRVVDMLVGDPLPRIC